MSKNRTGKIIGTLALIGVILIALHTCSGLGADSVISLGKGYFYRNEGENIKDIGCKRPEGGEIPATILQFAYNRKFIIARQKPEAIESAIYKEHVYKSGRDNNYYWIIEKATDLVIGPIDSLEFLQMRDKYHLPKDLVLE